MKTPLRFIIALFGNRHVGMLLPLLYSIEKSNPEAHVSLYWEDIDPAVIEDLQKAFLRLECIQTGFHFSIDITKRISSKTLVWEQAAEEKQNEEGWLIFIDADMLVVKDVSFFLEKFDSDGIFTQRAGQFPINSGVIAARASKKTADFFTLWLEKTDEVLKTPHLYTQANNKKLSYGGADQMALYLLLGYEGYQPERRAYEVALPGGVFRFSPAECEDLNETYSVPINDRTRMLHYKGGWRAILFEGGIFTKNRTRKASWPMLVFYHQTFQKALKVLRKRTGKEYNTQDFGLTTPLYLDPKTLTFRRSLYPLHWALWQVNNFFPRLLKFILVRFFPHSWTPFQKSDQEEKCIDKKRKSSCGESSPKSEKRNEHESS